MVLPPTFANEAPDLESCLVQVARLSKCFLYRGHLLPHLFVGWLRSCLHQFWALQIEVEVADFLHFILADLDLLLDSV